MHGMCEYFTVIRAWGRAVSADAEKEKQEGIQGQWQLESPFKEVMEQIEKHSDMSCNAYIMRRAYYAGEAGSWEGFKRCSETGEISEWASLELRKRTKRRL